MNLHDLMTNHKSIRKYKDTPVAEADLKKILKAATHGPSSVNGQQFSIIVVKDAEKKKKIAELTGGQKWIEQAPVFLVFVADFYRIGKSLEEKGLPFGNMASLEATMVGSVDCGIAFSNAMNTAESMGYGIVPIGAIRREPFEMIKLLKLPKYVYPVVGMCLGLPDESPMLKPRFPQSVMIHEEVYNPDVMAALNNYNKIVKKYMEKRTMGADVREWGETMNDIYTHIYFPKVKDSLKQQGFTNEA